MPGFWRHFNYEIFIISLWHNKTTTCADSFILLFLKLRDDSLRAIWRSFSRNNSEDIKDCFEGKHAFYWSFGSVLCWTSGFAEQFTADDAKMHLKPERLLHNEIIVQTRFIYNLLKSFAFCSKLWLETKFYCKFKIWLF